MQLTMGPNFFAYRQRASDQEAVLLKTVGAEEAQGALGQLERAIRISLHKRKLGMSHSKGCYKSDLGKKFECLVSLGATEA